MPYLSEKYRLFQPDPAVGGLDIGGLCVTLGGDGAASFVRTLIPLGL